MMKSHRLLYRSLLISFSLFAILIAGCKKKPVAAPPPPPPPPPAAAVKPTASLTADRTAIVKGQSVRLSWSTTDATSASIAPEVGTVTPQGSAAVTPADSTTYTLTATGDGGSAQATVHISVSVPTPVAEVPKPSFEELFLKQTHDAFFDLDKANIRPDAQDALKNSADFLKGYPNENFTIAGSCDERGSTEYNLALGQRRANAVKEYLVGLGIPADRINTISWGKEKPFCTESDEGCWQQNRRGHFLLNTK